MAGIWAFLADPDDFGWPELEKQDSAVWDGIKNAQAQRNLAQCGAGDVVLLYHTSPDKAIIGLARVNSGPRPDPSAPDRVVVDLKAVRKLARPLTLKELKADEVLSGLAFVKMPRVAVQPVTEAQLKQVLELSGTKR